MGELKPLENKMDEMLVKNAPFQIPENGRKAIVKYLPIISLIIGILSLLSVLTLWRSAHQLSEITNTANQIIRSYGGDTIEYGLFYYAALSSLVIQAVIMLMAYQPLKNAHKKGWDLLLYGVLVSLVYNIFYLVSDSGSVGSFIFGLIGTVVALYLLAQIRSHYKTTKSTDVSK